MEWFEISDITKIDTPALIVYRDRVKKNIERAIRAIGNADRLRPHVKTNKIAEVCRMMMDQGIMRFKCATIAEAEMLAMINAPDVLLAYQPNGPKAERYLQLNKKYPSVKHSCLVDDADVVRALSTLFAGSGQSVRVYIDLNTGMNRTGAAVEKAKQLVEEILSMGSVEIVGVHAYDGHIKESDPVLRMQQADDAFHSAELVIQFLEEKLQHKVQVIAGGSPTFSMHQKRDVQCSPGTFVFWDWGYGSHYPEEPYEFAALVVTRVISIVDASKITTDLGYKSVSAENPLPRVHFLNAPEVVPVSQSEEHLVLKVKDSAAFRVGDVLYGVPVHVCPTVALYDEAVVVENNVVVDRWEVVARRRKITV
jgi:D-serine deaminase-like pyridoxal phosphate-dependent protein